MNENNQMKIFISALSDIEDSQIKEPEVQLDAPEPNLKDLILSILNKLSEPKSSGMQVVSVEKPESEVDDTMSDFEKDIFMSPLQQRLELLKKMAEVPSKDNVAAQFDDDDSPIGE
jgi:hypothetical protein